MIKRKALFLFSITCLMASCSSDESGKDSGGGSNNDGEQNKLVCSGLKGDTKMQGMANQSDDVLLQSLELSSPRCDIKDFKDEWFAKLDYLETLAMFENISESRWNSSNKGLGLNIPIDGLPVGLDYKSMKRTVAQKAREYGYESFSQYSSTLVSSKLSEFGLDAYKYCQRSRGLFVYSGTDRSQSAEQHLVNVEMIPSPGCAPAKLEVIACSNIEDIKPLGDQLETADTCEGGGVNTSAALKPVDPYRPSSITIRGGRIGTVAWLPPLKDLFAQPSGTIGRSRQVIEVCKPRREGVKVFNNQDLVMELGAGNHNKKPIFSNLYFKGAYNGIDIAENLEEDFVLLKVSPNQPARLELPDGKKLIVNGSSFKDCTLGFDFSLQ